MIVAVGSWEFGFSESESVEQASEAVITSVQVSIVSELGQSAETLGSGLSWIDFPWVDIEVYGTSGAFDLF